MDWDKVKLSSLCKLVQYGYTTSATEEQTGIKFLRITDIVPASISWDDVPFCEIEKKEFEKYALAKGDIVIARTGATVGYAKYIKGDVPKAVFASYLIRIQINDSADSRFIGSLVESNLYKDYILNIAGGAAQPNANAQDLISFQFRLPPLPTQRRIAEVLGRYDDLIENSLRQIVILEASAQMLYREWFARGRCPFGEIENDGKLPAGWERVKLGDVLELKYGKSLTEEARVGGDYPVVGSSGIVDFHNEFLVDKGGIVVGRKGNVGSVFWIDKPFFPIDTAFYVESEMSLYYLFFNLKSQNFISGDAAVPGLNREQALSNEMIKPADEVLAKFDKVVQPIFEKVGNIQSQVALLRQMRDRLLPRLMSGRIPLTAAE
jgi:type I restriction enzyme S subunit